MDVVCIRCSNKGEVEKNKFALDRLIYEKKGNLLDNEVIRLSQELDKAIVKCSVCKKKVGLT